MKSTCRVLVAAPRGEAAGLLQSDERRLAGVEEVWGAGGGVDRCCRGVIPAAHPSPSLITTVCTLEMSLARRFSNKGASGLPGGFVQSIHVLCPNACSSCVFRTRVCVPPLKTTAQINLNKFFPSSYVAFTTSNLFRYSGMSFCECKLSTTKIMSSSSYNCLGQRRVMWCFFLPCQELSLGFHI